MLDGGCDQIGPFLRGFMQKNSNKMCPNIWFLGNCGKSSGHTSYVTQAKQNISTDVKSVSTNTPVFIESGP